MNFSETINKVKILPILAVLLLIVTIALPLLFSSREDAPQSMMGDAADIEVLLDSKLEGYDGSGSFAKKASVDHPKELSPSAEHKPDEHEIDVPAETNKHDSGLHDMQPSHEEEKVMHADNSMHTQQLPHDGGGEHQLQSEHDAKDRHLPQKTHESKSASSGDSHTAEASHVATGGHAMSSDGHEQASKTDAMHESLAGRVCYEIGPVKNDVQKNELEAVFRGHGMLASIKYQNVKRELGYWVYLPPMRSLALGRLKVEEIKLKGIKDVNLLINHEPKLAISLGIFNDQKNAHKRLLKAQSLGFAALMDVRHIEENELWLNLESSREKDLNDQEWSNLLQKYSPIELKAINCL